MCLTLSLLVVSTAYHKNCDFFLVVSPAYHLNRYDLRPNRVDILAETWWVRNYDKMLKQHKKPFVNIIAQTFTVHFERWRKDIKTLMKF